MYCVSCQVQLTPMRKSKRQGSCESNDTEMSTILPQKCIFCNADKYLKGSRTREKLSSCMQIRADNTIRKMATDRNDTAVMAIASDELIAKEARYHATCYRSYTKPVWTQLQSNSEIDSKYTKVWKFLSDLFDNPEVVPFKRLQALTTISGKKNLRRTIENNTDCYKFVNIEKELLIYPTSLEIDDIVTKYYQTFLQLQNLQNMELKEKVVSESARIIREEIKNVTYRMPWPPTSKDLEVSNFTNSTYLDSFLVCLLGSEEGKVSDRVTRLKSSFGQDLTYAGKYYVSRIY